MKKTALILSGGGFRGAFQYGALKFLNERGINYDIVAGISAGALNGSMIATDNFDLLSEFWKDVEKNGTSEIFYPEFTDLDQNMKLKWKRIYRHFFSDQNVFSLLTKGGRKRISSKWKVFNGLVNSNPLKSKLKGIMLNDFKSHFITGAVSLYDGKFHCKSNKDFTTSQQVRTFIEASATMPIICPPIKEIYTTNEVLTDLVDGGIRVILPISQVLKQIRYSKDDWEIIVVNCSSGILTPTKVTNVASIGLRALNDIALNQIFKNNLQTTEIINSFVKASGKKELNGYKYYPITEISPKGIDIGDTLDASKDIIKYRIEQGYKTAKQILEQR